MNNFIRFVTRLVRRPHGWAVALAWLLALGVCRTPPLSASLPTSPPSTALALTSSVTQQFAETSYYIKDVDFVSADIGWAVGEPHWDQARHTYVATIIHTTDGGLTWTPQAVDDPVALRGVEFVDATTGWAVGLQGAILHTTDGGAHWVRQTVASSDEFRGVTFVNATEGWVTSFYATHSDVWGEADDWRGSLWHTTDGGQTWQAQTLPPGASLLNRVKFLDAQHGWAVGVKSTGETSYGSPQHAGIAYRTTDGGQTWEELYSPGTDITLTGVEWVDMAHGWVVGFPNRSSLTGGFVFATTDGGQTWQRQTPGGFNEPLWDVQFVDAERGYAVGFDYVSAWGPPVYRTLNGGATWDKILMAKRESGEGFFAVAVAGNQIVVLGDHDLIARTTRAWDPFTPTPCIYGACLFSQTYLNTHYTFHDVFFVDETQGWAVGSRSYAPESWGQIILHTSDGGGAWVSQYEHQPPPDEWSQAFRLDSVYFLNASTGWAVGSSVTSWVTDHREHHGAILHTTDGGAHWQEQGQELYESWDLEFFSVQFLDTHNGWALAASRPGAAQNIFLVHTTDGGEHWAWVDSGLAGRIGIGWASVLGRVRFQDAQHGWAVGGLSQVIRTDDGGAHWTRPDTACGSHTCYTTALDMAMADSQTGWVVGEGGFQTRDGGAHWTHYDLGINGEIQAIQFVDAHVGWLVTSRGEAWYTTSGGMRWRRLAERAGSPLRGLHFANVRQGWFVGDAGTIVHYAAEHVPIQGELFVPMLRK